MMLLYTTLISFPLMIIVLYNCEICLLIFPGFNSYFPLIFGLVVFFAFSVKMPLYGLHYWLPMAHVEAPTSGSMILAGILLKLGGVGLLRFSLSGMFASFSRLFFSYLLFAVVLASVVTCFQVDFKRLVAYSSVVHMTVILLSLVSFTRISFKAFLMVMVFHGIVSPFMFMLVGVVYKLFSSRLIPFIHGSLSLSYSLSFMLVFVFLINVPTPPFSSFLSEVALFLGLINFGFFSYAVVGLYVFLSVVFNVYWLSGVVFAGSSVSSTSFFMTLAEFLFSVYYSFFMVFSVLLVGLF